jgi:hypothetical protein
MSIRQRIGAVDFQQVARLQRFQRLSRLQCRQRTFQPGEVEFVAVVRHRWRRRAAPSTNIIRAGASRQHIVDRDRRPLHHGGDGRNVVEMHNRQRGFQGRIGRDADDAGIIRE